MAVHLIPFVAGAVIGGLAAYFYRDEKLRADLRKTAGDVSDKVSEGLHGLRGKVSRREEPPPKKAVRKRATKKAATGKKAARKRAAPKKKAAAAGETPPPQTE